MPDVDQHDFGFLFGRGGVSPDGGKTWEVNWTQRFTREAVGITASKGRKCYYNYSFICNIYVG
jgi:hypothetical protein